MSNRREYKLQVPEEGVSFDAACSRIAEGVYHLESIPISAQSIAYGDTFEAEEADGGLRVRRVLRRAGRRNFIFVLSNSTRESGGLRRLLARLERQGAVWEQSFGGLLAISLPAASRYDPTADLRKLDAGPANRPPRAMAYLAAAVIFIAITFGAWAYRGINGDPRMRIGNLRGLTPAEVVARLGPPDYDPRRLTPPWTPADEQKGHPLKLYYHDRWSWLGHECGIVFKQGRVVQITAGTR